MTRRSSRALGPDGKKIVRSKGETFAWHEPSQRRRIRHPRPASGRTLRNMIGRGTRLRRGLFGPGVDKSDFYVFDFCGNLEFFSQDLPGSEGSLQKSLTQRLFETRLGLIRGLDGAGTDQPLRASTTETLHRFVAGMTLDNVLVRPHRKWVERYADGAAWTSTSDDGTQQLLTHLAGLPSTDTGDDEQAKRLDLIVLRRQLAQLDGDAVTAERLREQVQEIAGVLLGKQAIPSVAEQLALLDAVAGDEWWIDVTLPMLEVARLRIRGLLRFVEKGRRNPVYTDFADELTEAVEVDLPGVVPGTNPERYRAEAASYFREHEDLLSGPARTSSDDVEERAPPRNGYPAGRRFRGTQPARG